jgi:NADH-quinone oxidoreductase subunit L
VRGTLGLSRALAWFDATVVDGIVNGAATLTRLVSTINGLIDDYLVDGLVNFIANFTNWLGGLVRRLQTGSINAYLYGIVVVVTAVLFATTW